MDRQNLEKFLKSNSENGGNVVVYNGVIRSDDTDETFSHQMNATKDYTYLRGLYKVRNGNAVFEDERIPRSIGVARFELFWVWFPDARTSLNKSKVFNSRNSSQPITYDHMLNSRRFNSTIYKEENVYEDREVKDYIYEDALRMLLESERIKSVIRDYEQDMWNN